MLKNLQKRTIGFLAILSITIMGAIGSVTAGLLWKWPPSQANTDTEGIIGTLYWHKYMDATLSSWSGHDTSCLGHTVYPDKVEVCIPKASEGGGRFHVSASPLSKCSVCESPLQKNSFNIIVGDGEDEIIIPILYTAYGPKDGIMCGPMFLAPSGNFAFGGISEIEIQKASETYLDCMNCGAFAGGG